MVDSGRRKSRRDWWILDGGIGGETGGFWTGLGGLDSIQQPLKNFEVFNYS